MCKKSENTRHVLVLTLLACLCLRTEAIQTHDLENYCGYSVSRYVPVGILRFNTSTFFDRKGYQRECKVKVSPEQVPGSDGRGRVQFYFTEFDLPGSCSDLSVLLLDGSSTYDPRVIGAPMALCANNATLTSPGLVFNTTASLFSVALNWTQPASTWRSGGFILKFSAFYDGPCDDNDEVTTCNNMRCTSKAYHCDDDIDTCGPVEKSSCTAKVGDKGFWENVLDWLKKTAKEIGILIAICIGIYFLVEIFKLLRGRYGSLSNFIDKFCGNRSSSSPPEPEDQFQPLSSRRNSASISMEMTQSSEVARPTVARSDSSSSIASNITDYEARDPDPQAQPGPAAPPPSYDSLGSFKMTSPPSYDDFLSNEDKYKEKP